MAAGSVEAILLRLGMDTSGLSDGARKAKAELGGLEGAVGALKGSFASLAATATAGLGFAALTRKALDFAESVTKVHEQTGLATDTIQFLRFAADQTGGSVEGLGSLVNKMQQQLVAAGSDDKLAQKFRDMGVSIEELRGLRPEEQLQSLAVAVSNISDPADRTAAAIAAFGKAGAEALPQLQALAEQNDQLAEAFAATGGAVSADAIAQVESLGDSMGQVTTAVTSLATELLAVAAPSLRSFLQTVTEVVGGLRLLDGEGDNAAVNLGNKIREAQEKLNNLRTIAEKYSSLDNKYYAAAIDQQERLVRRLREREEAMLQLGETGALVARREAVGNAISRQLMEEGAANLTASLSNEQVIRDNFGELRFEQDTALEERLFEQREAARERELQANWSFHQQMSQQAMDAAQVSGEDMADTMQRASDLKITTLEQDLSTTLGVLSQESAGVSRHSKKMFELNKSLALADAAVKLPSAILKSYENAGGYPLGIAAAAAMAIIGAAQIQAIASAKFGGGTAPSQAAAPATPVAPAQSGGQGAGGGGQVIRAEGINPDSLFTGKQVRAIAERLVELQADGGKVIFS